MKHTNTTLFVRIALLIAGVSALSARSVPAQVSAWGDHVTRIVLSANGDFSSHDAVFGQEDSIHVLVEARGLDVTAVEEQSYSIDARQGDSSHSGTLTNNLDGTFTAVIAASDLWHASTEWTLTASLRDASGHMLQGRAHFALRNHEADPTTFNLHGVVEAASDSSIVVAGREILVTPRTDIRGLVGIDLSLDRLTGLLVTVVVQETDAGLLAVHIYLHPRADENRWIDVSGTIALVGDGVIEVDTTEVMIDEQTEIVWRGFAFRPTALLAGMTVDVHALVTGDDNLLARRILVTGFNGIELSVRGEITAIEGDLVTIEETSFHVLPTTHLIATGGATIEIGGLQVGQQAKAFLVLSDSETYDALVVVVEDEETRRRIRLAGRIEAIEGNAFSVGGLRFEVNDETTITDRFGNDAPFGLLHVGTVVQARGVVLPDGGVLATEVHIRARIHAHGRIQGAITAVTDDSLYVEEVAFGVASFTAFRGGAGSLEELREGQHVLVHFVVLASGKRLALMVATRPDPPQAIIFRGSIDSLIGDVVVVAGMPLTVTDETSFFDEDGMPIDASDLAVGQIVGVHANKSGDHLVAVRVKVLHSIVIAAPVDAFDDDSLRVAGQVVLIRDETLIVGSDNQVLTRTALHSGASVEIVAISEDERSSETASESILVADRVMVSESRLSTGAEERDVAGPAGFVLEQNYPNPFNPTTTISFDITHARPVQTTLSVYNVLGQRVATLVNSVLEPGRHVYEWHTAENGGSAVASGVYLYRLEVDGRAETRSMILMK